MVKRSMRTLAGGLAAGLFLAAPAWAFAGNVPLAFQAGAKTIMAMSHGQAIILKTFPTKAGLNGYTVQVSPGHALIMYSTKNGKYVFMGGLFTASGTNESVRYAQKYLPAADKPRVISPVDVGTTVQKTTNFLIGKPDAPKQVWMVADPNCIFCHLAWDHLKSYVDNGSLAIHLIPVGFLKPSSLPKAATIIASTSPAKEWRFDEAHFNSQEEEGGIVPKAQVSAEDTRSIQANNRWMNAHGIHGTPALIYKNPQGKWQVTPGMPRNTAAFVQDVG